MSNLRDIQSLEVFNPCGDALPDTGALFRDLGEAYATNHLSGSRHLDAERLAACGPWL
jgi:hypothetical protein